MPKQSTSHAKPVHPSCQSRTPFNTKPVHHQCQTRAPFKPNQDDIYAKPGRPPYKTRTLFTSNYCTLHAKPGRPPYQHRTPSVSNHYTLHTNPGHPSYQTRTPSNVKPELLARDAETKSNLTQWHNLRTIICILSSTLLIYHIIILNGPIYTMRYYELKLSTGMCTKRKRQFMFWQDKCPFNSTVEST